LINSGWCFDSSQGSIPGCFDSPALITRVTPRGTARNSGWKPCLPDRGTGSGAGCGSPSSPHLLPRNAYATPTHTARCIVPPTLKSPPHKSMRVHRFHRNHILQVCALANDGCMRRASQTYTSRITLPGDCVGCATLVLQERARASDVKLHQRTGVGTWIDSYSPAGIAPHRSFCGLWPSAAAARMVFRSSISLLDIAGLVGWPKPWSALM